MALRYPLKNVIIFDGVCNLCNGWVDVILKYDTARKMKFTAAQRPKGTQLLQLIGKNPDELSSVVYIRELSSPDAPVKKEIYFKSEAVLRVLEDVGVPKVAVSALMMTVPASFRDLIYDTVAENRYNIMGKRDSCRHIDSDF